jgi:2-polyprenyl-3-methyl-5-hydroxy-6-metoxy-1,4-benzoquinol methylase
MNKYLKYILIKGRSTLIDTANRLKSNKTIFEDIFEKGGWQNNESVSGSGSTLQNTRRIIQLLPDIFQEYNIKSVLDIPCGDFNWMRQVSMENIKYTGCDIVEKIVVNNNQKHLSPQRSFYTADITRDELPCVDLIFCRDCLVHFSNRDVLKALTNILKSRSRFLLTTTFPEHQNQNIVTGNWRPLNLQSAPFNLPQPLKIFFEGCDEVNGQYSDKALALWDNDTLKKTLQRYGHFQAK